MTEILFRKAQLADVPAIIALLADDVLGRLREDPSQPLDQRYIAAFHSIDADPNQLLAVAVSGDEVIGTLQLTFIQGLARKGAWRGQIEAVRIARSHRGTGFGKQMFTWAVEQCQKRGCHLVQLTTDKTRTDAHRFYDHLGFEASHLGYKLTLQ
ncbi:GNAT family N-acetyltransferase [Enterobacter sp. Cy-643]|uniref:GNAT family N-acetyltransferase n=1 Tax=Enterobacter sp. Cy-643 TaxID=2608346 RepID=UPI00141E0084|nr:GNAT family N-acetyltransferase [Enterobacter sp. Cy-643]NIF32058.1 GNAT family N-acetyltransferase [Enterobacter sp. Cy-643]